jgi:phosphatidate cytidylyltransferase
VDPVYWIIFYSLTVLLVNFENIRTLETGRIILYANTSDGIQQIVGKRWGRNKIVSSISPNKTLEGYIGGFLCMYIISYITNISILYYFTGISGDLLCSYSKRKLGIKDWSNILGSHGGFLDRFNSSIIGLNLLFGKTLGDVFLRIYFQKGQLITPNSDM